MTELTENDEGKPVKTADGEQIGMISGVRGGTAYVDPEAGITDRIKSMLGWEDVDEDDYALAESEIDTVTDDEVRLSR
jgi:hypothetical protein